MKGPTQSDGSPGQSTPRAREEAHRRTLSVGIGASAVVHAVVVLLYSIVITQWGPRETVMAVATPTRSVTGMRVVRLVEIESPEATVELPDEIPEPVVEIQAVLPEGPPSAESIVVEEPVAGLRAAEVLRVRSSDSRLWRQALPEAFELTQTQRMELELAGKLEEWNDSVAAAVAAEYALTDWTTTDSQGRRWGVSPGQLHLGDLTLPLPFYFQGSSFQRERAARRAWEDQDIANGANTQVIRESWRDRAEAIRRRRDRDRNENSASADSTGTGG